MQAEPSSACSSGDRIEITASRLGPSVNPQPSLRRAHRYLNALQTTSQHLLRYLAAAVVINKRRRNAIKDVIRIIEQEAYEFKDPITEFLQALFVQYDFEGAQHMLQECEQLIENDYLLTAIKEVSLCGRLLGMTQSSATTHNQPGLQLALCLSAMDAFSICMIVKRLCIAPDVEHSLRVLHRLLIHHL